MAAYALLTLQVQAARGWAAVGPEAWGNCAWQVSVVGGPRGLEEEQEEAMWAGTAKAEAASSRFWLAGWVWDAAAAGWTAGKQAVGAASACLCW